MRFRFSLEYSTNCRLAQQRQLCHFFSLLCWDLAKFNSFCLCNIFLLIVAILRTVVIISLLSLCCVTSLCSVFSVCSSLVSLLWFCTIFLSSWVVFVSLCWSLDIKKHKVELGRQRCACFPAIQCLRDIGTVFYVWYKYREIYLYII